MLIHGVAGTVHKNHVYILAYNGVLFITKSREPLPLVPDIEARELQPPL